MATRTFERTIKLTVIECPTCFVLYGIPWEMNRELRRDADNGKCWCPNGHTWCYRGQSMEDQLTAAEARATHAEDQLIAAERQLARVSNGVCPCCNRTFVQLARHMKAKHPDFRP